MLRDSENPSKEIEKELCVFCEKKYLSTETLKQHILTDHKPNSYKCQNVECDRIFTTKARMLDHVDVIHMNREGKKWGKYILSYICPFDVCGKIENTKVSLAKHIASNHRGNHGLSFKCKFCGEEFLDQYKLGGHRRRKHPEESEFKAVEPFPCLFCNKKIKTKYSLNNHMSRKHSDIPEDQRLTPERPKSSQCKFCEKSFQSKYVLRDHTRVEHPGKSRNWSRYKMQQLSQVNKENIETTNIPGVNGNEDQMDSSNTIEDDFPVENISVQTSAEDDSKAEKEAEANGKECTNQDIVNSKIEVDDIVGEFFVTDYIETNSKKDSTKLDSNTYMGTISNGNEENAKEISTQLEITEEIDIKQDYDFPAYRRTNSKEISTQPDFIKDNWNEDCKQVLKARNVGEKVPPRHLCEKCPFSCDRPYILRDHILSTHEGQRIECNICNARFQRSKNLREHVRTKHAKEKIMCERCDFTTNWKVALVKHQQTQHGIVKEKLTDAVKTLSCEKCNHVARTQASLKDHNLYKHGGRKHQCTKCPSTFVRERDLKRHIGSKHKFNEMIKEEPLSPNSSPCEKCDHVARSEWSLKEHIRSKHEGIKHQCNKCATFFVRERDLKRHIVSKHSL